MKKAIVLLIFLLSFAFGTTTTIIKSGWQMVGLNSDVEDMSIFSSENVDQLWIYDTSTQSWSGYSPDSQKLAKIKELHGVISRIDRWQGVWIKSTKEWYLTQDTQTKSDSPIDTITLKKGWNLISIPLDSMISPKVFDNNETLIWKYSESDWQLFDTNMTGFNHIETIKSSDGLWVKVENDRSVDISKESASLQTFESQEEMKAYIETLTKVDHYSIYYPMVGLAMSEETNTIATTTADLASPTTADSSESIIKDASNTTSTNLQETGVDESNTIKSDNRYVYYLNNSSNKIEIHSFANLSDNKKEVLGSIDLKDDYKSIDSFYLYGIKLVTISNRYDNVTQVVVDVYDISNVSKIVKLESFSLDASLISSRILNNKLVVVSTFYPTVEIEYPKVYLDDMDECKSSSGRGVSYSSVPTVDNIISESASSEEIKVIDAVESTIHYGSKCQGIYFNSDAKAYRYDYDNPVVSNKYLIPQLSYSKYSGDLISYKSFYAPHRQNQTPNITTVSSFDLNTLEYVKSSAIVGNSSTVYASTNALYTISQDYPIYYNYKDYQERSVIYKFDLVDDLAFEAMGFINGRILNQFSLSQYNQTLRVATTEGFSWGGETSNSIFTLQQNGYTLETVGYLGSLGKEGETIQSVRFIDTKGFVVTFRETDPLYTLDLSDPLNPSKVGELEINGFSQYMHLVDSDRLLTIGRDANSKGQLDGILIELFDISDFANPRLASKLTIGDSSYTSEALSNHKAFIYRSSDALFGFDYRNYNNYTTNYFGTYQVDGLYLKEIEKLSIDSSNSYNCNPRSVIYDYNGQSYLSYFCSDSVMTKTLPNKENE
jgi:uncharacterized secreted protein with C-terminal beta-propeller domain